MTPDEWKIKRKKSKKTVVLIAKDEFIIPIEKITSVNGPILTIDSDNTTYYFDIYTVDGESYRVEKDITKLYKEEHFTGFFYDRDIIVEFNEQDYMNLIKNKHLSLYDDVNSEELILKTISDLEILKSNFYLAKNKITKYYRNI